jgi:hypothetical protein
MAFYGGYGSSSYGYGGGVFSTFVYWLDYWGVRDVILPFILIFTIFFAVMQKIHLFGAQDKKYNVAIALAVALLTVIPHATGTYPPGMDIVNIINDSIPEIALLVIVVVMLLMMLGLGLGKGYGLAITGWVALLAAVVLVLIFANALIPVPILQYIDPSIQALIIILLVFGIVVWFVTYEPKGKKTFWEMLTSEIPYKKPPEEGGGASH